MPCPRHGACRNRRAVSPTCTHPPAAGVGRRNLSGPSWPVDNVATASCQAVAPSRDTPSGSRDSGGERTRPGRTQFEHAAASTQLSRDASGVAWSHGSPLSTSTGQLRRPWSGRRASVLRPAPETGPCQRADTIELPAPVAAPASHRHRRSGLTAADPKHAAFPTRVSSGPARRRAPPFDHAATRPRHGSARGAAV
jgi:hypothetical protein